MTSSRQAATVPFRVPHPRPAAAGREPGFLRRHRRTVIVVVSLAAIAGFVQWARASADVMAQRPANGITSYLLQKYPCPRGK